MKWQNKTELSHIVFLMLWNWLSQCDSAVLLRICSYELDILNCLQLMVFLLLFCMWFYFWFSCLVSFTSSPLAVIALCSTRTSISLSLHLGLSTQSVPWTARSTSFFLFVSLSLNCIYWSSSISPLSPSHQLCVEAPRSLLWRDAEKTNLLRKWNSLIFVSMNFFFLFLPLFRCI